MSDIWPIGVFASIDAGLGVRLEVAQGLGIKTIQLHAPHCTTRTPQHAEQFLARLRQLGITLTAVFCGFEGESYADIPTTKRTVGLVPPETRAERVREMKAIADFARLLGCDVVGLHLGFIPEDAADRTFPEVVAVTQDICDHAQRSGQRIHLETGQESADGLLHFIAAVGRSNLKVNFDPANMILYGTGEPIAAVKRIGRHVGSVHCKDGKWAKNPGQEWGQEMPLGQGDVGMENFLRALKEIGYTGPLTIEREIPQDPARQKAEIGAAVRLLEELRHKLV